MKKKSRKKAGKTKRAKKNIRGKSPGTRKKTPLGDHDRKVLPFPARGDEFYFRGLEKTEAGRHREALADLDRAIRLDPRDSHAYHARGLAKSGLGRHAEALADIDRLIRSRPPRRGPCGY